MRKKIVLHLGANKTGSSAVQRFLALNVAALREQGIIVPDAQFRVADSVQGAHVFSFEQLFRAENGRELLEDAIAGIHRAAPEATTILLSAENLAASQKAPALFEQLSETHDIRAIIYVRRQDDYILSAWQQWNSKVLTDFWAWALASVGTLGNWRHYLERWETVVPRQSITVRVFERDRLEGGDVIADFHRLLGTSLPLDQLAYPDSIVNPSFSHAVMDLVKGNDLIFENVHDNGFYNLVSSLTGDRFVKKGRESSLTFKQRTALLQRYAPSNRWVRDHYFPQGPDELFMAPRPSDYDYLTSEQIEQQKFEFLVTMLYRMHKDGR